jgi:hypothetical protein
MATPSFLEFNSNQYSVKNLVYPLDLLEDKSSSKYDGNRIVFFINVASGGKTSGFQDGGEYTTLDVPDGDKKMFSGQKALDKLARESEVSIASASMRRLAAAIVLYMPTSINSRTGVSWDEADLGGSMDTSIEMAAQASQAAAEADGFLNKVVAATKSISQSTRGAIGAALLKGNAAARSARETPGNTRAEMLFNRVNFRQFDFNFQFLPKSQEEAMNVMNIVKMFKHHMLPEFKDPTSFLYIYPSEFNVKIYSGSKENPYIEKYMTAVCTSVSIDYTPNGMFNAFKDGIPQQINLSMSFQEIGLPTKNSESYKFEDLS